MALGAERARGGWLESDNFSHKLSHVIYPPLTTIEVNMVDVGYVRYGAPTLQGSGSHSALDM